MVIRVKASMLPTVVTAAMVSPVIASSMEAAVVMSALRRSGTGRLPSEPTVLVIKILRFFTAHNRSLPSHL
jgi:hypothetical protein